MISNYTPKTTLLSFLNFLKAFIYLFLVSSNLLIAQTTTINFETEDSGYTPSATEGSGWTDVFNRTNFNISGVTNEDGYYWAVEDLTLTNPFLTLDQIDISGSGSFTFSIDMTTHHYNDWDATDELLITYSIDGGSYENLMAVQMVTQGDSNGGTNEPAALDVNFDGAGDCGTDTTLPSISTGTGSQSCSTTTIGKNFKTFTTSSIPLSSNSTLDIKLQFNGLTGNDEGIYLDNIIITEASSSTTWNGITNTDWATASNWSNGVPTSSLDATIPDETNAPIIGNTTGASVKDLTINESDGLTIIGGGSLIVAGAVDGTASGNITYKRNLATNN